MKERKYIIVCRLFEGISAASCPCVGQIATNSKIFAYILYQRWTRFSYRNTYSIAVMLMKRNNNGRYDAIKR